MMKRLAESECDRFGWRRATIMCIVITTTNNNHESTMRRYCKHQRIIPESKLPRLFTSHSKQRKWKDSSLSHPSAKQRLNPNPNPTVSISSDKINLAHHLRKRKAATIHSLLRKVTSNPSNNQHITMEPLARTTLRALRPRIAKQPTAPLTTLRSITTTTSHYQNAFPNRQQPQNRQPTSALPMPFVTETVNGGYHTSDIFSRLLKERIICLNGEVEEVLSASIVAQLLFLEADNPTKPISLYINSPGGSVTAGLAIYDTMQYIRSPVTTICLGQAASMGSLLLCGGAPGQRYVLPHSRIMVHQVSGGYSGQASDIAIHAKEILRVREQLNLIYKRHLTVEKSLEEIERVMERDFFMGAQEALEWGIVDRILDRREDAAAAAQK